MGPISWPEPWPQRGGLQPFNFPRRSSSTASRTRRTIPRRACSRPARISNRLKKTSRECERSADTRNCRSDVLVPSSRDRDRSTGDGVALGGIPAVASDVTLGMGPIEYVRGERGYVQGVLTRKRWLQWKGNYEDDFASVSGGCNCWMRCPICNAHQRQRRTPLLLQKRDGGNEQYRSLS
jgi:hypothetical protein